MYQSLLHTLAHFCVRSCCFHNYEFLEFLDRDLRTCQLSAPNIRFDYSRYKNGGRFQNFCRFMCVLLNYGLLIDYWNTNEGKNDAFLSYPFIDMLLN